MTSDDLRAWQAAMGYTYDTAAGALGMSRRAYAEMVNGRTTIDKRTALACAALAAGLEGVGAHWASKIGVNGGNVTPQAQ